MVRAAGVGPAIMPIPALGPEGFLPPGVYDCTLEEIGARFGTFSGSDRRPQLWSRFIAFVQEAKASGLIEALLMDGSFVTADAKPNDIDLIVVVSELHDFSADVGPHSYNLLAQSRVRRRFGFDVVVVKNGSGEEAEAVAFFEQVRQRPGVRKGLLRLRI